MRKVICERYPEVLGILTNNVLYRYGKAGVNYVEFSIGVKTLRDKVKRKNITDNVFSTPYPRMAVKGKGEYTLKAKAAEVKTTFTLPVLKVSELKPSWRRYLNDYHDKASHQTWVFLAAFHRTEPDTYSKAALLDENPPEVKSTEKLQGVHDLLQLIGNVDDDQELLHLAQRLVEDPCISKIYKTEIEDVYSFLQEYLVDNPLDRKESLVTLQECVAGVDWVSDEFGFPFCAFTSPKVMNKLKECREVNPNFGVRIHGGEGLIRFSTAMKQGAAVDRSSAVGKVFRFHLFVLMATIRKVHQLLMEESEVARLQSLPDWNGNCNIRIGHGVALLYSEASDEMSEADRRNSSSEMKTAEDESVLHRELKSFREFLANSEIPCELNPTSNHMLIPGTFVKNQTVTNDRSLEGFFKHQVPVVLCTDDDGIWAIQKCERHHHHISVGHEFCEAIGRKEITNSKQIDQLVSDGRKYAFAKRPETKSIDENRQSMGEDSLY
jgi:hypothetical protein